MVERGHEGSAGSCTLEYFPYYWCCRHQQCSHRRWCQREGEAPPSAGLSPQDVGRALGKPLCSSRAGVLRQWPASRAAAGWQGGGGGSLTARARACVCVGRGHGGDVGCRYMWSNPMLSGTLPKEYANLASPSTWCGAMPLPPLPRGPAPFASLFMEVSVHSTVLVRVKPARRGQTHTT